LSEPEQAHQVSEGAQEAQGSLDAWCSIETFHLLVSQGLVNTPGGRVWPAGLEKFSDLVRLGCISPSVVN
jgi:hypothetical protein